MILESMNVNMESNYEEYRPISTDTEVVAAETEHSSRTIVSSDCFRYLMTIMI
jgi:hypothetical protein